MQAPFKTDPRVWSEPERRCNGPSATTASQANWWVPLTYATKSSPRLVQWHPFEECVTELPVQVTQQNATLNVTGISSDAGDSSDTWVLLNAGRFGYYRVNYSQPMWQALLEDIQGGKSRITATDLAGE